MQSLTASWLAMEQISIVLLKDSPKGRKAENKSSSFFTYIGSYLKLLI